MPSYVISEIVTLDHRLDKINYLHRVLSENILSYPSYYSVKDITKSKLDGKDFLKILMKEPVEINFTKFGISFKSEIQIFIYLIYFQQHQVLMISSPRGIGLSRKGGLRRYIDLTIWQNFLRNLLSDQVNYNPIIFNNIHLDFQNWGDELIEINLNIHGFGKIRLVSREFQDNIKVLNKVMNFDELLSIGEISKIKVKSHILKKVVDVRSSGIIKVNEKDNLKVLKYLTNILTKLYEP